MQLHKFLSVLATLSVVASAAAQTEPSTNAPLTNVLARPPGWTERVLSVDQCIQLALSNNLDIKFQTFNPLISLYTLNAAYEPYDPALSFTARKSHNESPQTISIITNINFGNYVQETESYSAGLTGQLPNGLTYDFTGPLSKTAYPGSLTPTTWSSSDFGFTSISQPLLKNFWIDNTRATIQIDKANLKISKQQLRLQIITTITAVKTAYYNLIFARGNVEANARALQLAQQLADENKMKVQIGTLAQLDEKQAESQAAASQAALLSAQHQLAAQENTLKSLLTGNYSDWATVAPVPSEQLVAVPETLDRQDCWRLALTQRPEMIEDKLTVEKQKVTIKYDQNQLFPEIDLTGSYGHNANSTSLGTTVSDLANGRYLSWSYGVQMSYPLGSVGVRNAYKASKASLEQLLVQLKQEEQGIMVAVDNDIGQVQSTYEQVKATREARLYAEDALAAEQTKLANGKSTSFNVLQLISNLTAARVSEIQALANYNIARAQLEEDEGATIEANNIDFKVR